MKLFSAKFTHPGFYLIEFEDGSSKKYYVPTIERQRGNTCSFLAISPNNRNPHMRTDFGIFLWANSYNTINPPVKWRTLTGDEIIEFKKELFHFDRKWPLTN